MEENSASFSRLWKASTCRRVPDLERITSDWVMQPEWWNLTPCSKSPSVIPVAEKKQLSPATRSSVVRTLSRS